MLLVSIPSIAGSGTSGVVDGVGTWAKFTPSISGLAVATNGNIYLIDSGSYNVRLITTAGTVTTYSGSGGNAYANGPGVFASYYTSSDSGLAADSLGNVYVADTSNYRIRKIVPSTGISSSLAGSGNQAFIDGLGSAASFYDPRAIAVRRSILLFHSNMNL